MAGRHREHRGVVEGAGVAFTLDDAVANPVRQDLAILDHGGGSAPGVGGDEIGDPLALHRRVVDVEDAVDHLDAVAGQADDALDVIGRSVARQLEHGDVAALRLGGPDPALEQRRAERHRVLRIAVGVFRDEQVIADQQRRDQRARGDVEGLEQQGADHEGDEQRLDDDLDRLEDAAFVLGLVLDLGVVRHAGLLLAAFRLRGLADYRVSDNAGAVWQVNMGGMGDRFTGRRHRRADTPIGRRRKAPGGVSSARHPCWWCQGQFRQPADG
ncbi:hypothetical protein BOS5A_200099 [Bosea sp. EC-HK365B]|nr:hypothetical protein BOSE21B_100099 [Bosea sp. 21B]CAD5286378.1 hypothetical protein BOSE7B_41430 [Bosea sp. 7B]VVT57444.1 hypothetical protein BOS5A_200099 [Bosea sp. EC-HK365B]